MTLDSSTQPIPVRAGLDRSQIMRAAGVVMASFALTGLLGIIRQAIIASQFGASGSLDAYIAANQVSETLFTLVSGGALGSAFIPVFARLRKRDPDDTTDIWRLISATATLISVLGTGLALIVALLAAPIVSSLLLPAASTAEKALTVRLLREMLPTVVIFGLSGLVMAILNAQQRFLAAALAPSWYNIGRIIGALIFTPLLSATDHGIDGLAYGTLLGAVLHLGVQLPTLWKLPGARLGLRLRLEPYAPGVIEVFRLMLPRVLGLGIIQINFWVNAALASGMAAGSLTELSFAFALLFTILGLFGQSVGTAVFPTLAALDAEADVAGFRRVLLGALRGVLFLAIPATIGLWLLAEPLIATIYGRGAWTAADTAGTALALRLYAVGLVGFALQEVLARAFYALKNTRTPVTVGSIGVVLNVILSIILMRIVPGQVGGLALANAIATLIESAALWILIEQATLGKAGSGHRHVQVAGLRPSGVPIWTAVAEITASAAIMGIIVYGFTQIAANWAPFFKLTIGASIGIGTFGGVALLFGLDEARRLPVALRSRLRRRIIVPTRPPQ